jgi:arsenite methyltransferase
MRPPKSQRELNRERPLINPQKPGSVLSPIICRSNVGRMEYASHASEPRTERKRLIGFHGYLRLRRYLSRLHILRWLHSSRFVPVGNLLLRLDRRLLRFFPPDVRLRHEFNLWAEKGLGESMEVDHLWFTERTLSRMGISSADRILDLGCGEGWACRLIAARLGDLCPVVGLDVADEMVRRARTKSSQFTKVSFLCGSAEHIPCREKVFTKVLSVSAFYYFEHQERVLRELLRVVVPAGQLFLLIALYKDLPNWHDSARGLRVPVHVRSADEYTSMLRAAGWMDVQAQELVRERHPSSKTGGHNRALLISAQRSALESAISP